MSKLLSRRSLKFQRFDSEKLTPGVVISGDRGETGPRGPQVCSRMFDLLEKRFIL